MYNSGMSTWSNKIKLLMKAKGITPKILAKQLNISRGAVGHYLKERRNPPLNKLKKIAEILDVPLSVLITDSEILNFPTDDNPNKEIKLQKLPITYVPLISWETLSKALKNGNLKFDDKDIIRMIPTVPAKKISSRSFALPIQDDSMSGTTVPNFTIGEIIIIDPDKEHKAGSYLIVAHKTSYDCTFKQYRPDGANVYLKPLNPQYPVIDATEYDIVGACVGKYSDIND